MAADRTRLETIEGREREREDSTIGEERRPKMACDDTRREWEVAQGDVERHY